MTEILMEEQKQLALAILKDIADFAITKVCVII